MHRTEFPVAKEGICLHVPTDIETCLFGSFGRQHFMGNMFKLEGLSSGMTNATAAHLVTELKMGSSEDQAQLNSGV